MEQNSARISPDLHRSPDDAAARNAGVTATDLQLVLRRVHNRLRANAANLFAGFTTAQLTTLSLVEREGEVTASELATALDVRPQSMAATLSTLYNGALIQRTKDTVDKRQTLVSITQAGRDLLQAVRQSDQDWLARAIADNLTAGQEQKLVEATSILEYLLEQTADLGGWPRLSKVQRR